MGTTITIGDTIIITIRRIHYYYTDLTLKKGDGNPLIKRVIKNVLIQLWIQETKIGLNPKCSRISLIYNQSTLLKALNPLYK